MTIVQQLKAKSRSPQTIGNRRQSLGVPKQEGDFVGPSPHLTLFSLAVAASNPPGPPYSNLSRSSTLFPHDPR